MSHDTESRCGILRRLRRPRHRRSWRPRPLWLEVLEDRTVPSAVQALATPGYVVALTNGKVSPTFTPGQDGYTPQQIATAYGFNKITPPSGQLLGSGTTIAIVDAYNDPTISTDLKTFDTAFGLPNPPSLTVVSQTGSTTLPASNASWSLEISLDVEWAHAIAPGANILLVEANSASESNLLAAERYAASQSGVVVVSNSWGGSEFSGETSDDSYFTTPSGHPGVTFVVAAGDSGAPDEYPSASPDVLSVGGTTLNLADSNGDYGSESAWSGSGGGVSADEPQPSYQNGVVSQYSTTKRTNPDVAYDADPNTGFPVADSYAYGTSNPWVQVGGTSDAAPQWAALIAIADQERIAAGEPTLNSAGSTQTLPAIYGLPASDFHDITTGESTGSPPEAAGPGYDLATGRGTPIANLVVAGLVDQSSTQVTQFGVTATPGSPETAGQSFTVTVTPENAAGQYVSGYTGTATVSSSDGKAVLNPSTLTFTGGTATFSATLETAGSQSITVTGGSVSGSVNVTVNPTTASQLVFGQQPSNTSVGGSISPAVAVLVEDQYGNLVTSYGNASVTLSLTGNPSGVTLGNATEPIVNGIATFSNLTVSQAGTWSLTPSSSTGLAGSQSTSFSVSNTVTQFGVTVSPGSPETAGQSFTVTVTPENAAGQYVSGYTGTATVSSSDGKAVLNPSTLTFSGSTATFSATLETAGSQSITVTGGSVSGSVNVTVNPTTASQLVFGQQPSNTSVGGSISPAVTVLVEDQYGNLVTSYGNASVTLSLTGNPSGVTLGNATEPIVNGVATFSNLTVSQAGTYSLTAGSGTLSTATSGSFNVSSSSPTTIENFENGLGLYYAYGGPVYAATDTAAAHDGNYGLDLVDRTYNPGWAVRLDSGAQVSQGEAISVWVQLPGVDNGRAYFAFGASTGGALSAVLAPNTGQLIIMNDSGWGFTNLAAVNQSYQANTWYRLEVDWATGGGITVGLYASNGTTLLNSVSTTVTNVTSGGIGFRGTDAHVYFDTVTVTPLNGPSVLQASLGGAAGTAGLDATGLAAAVLPAEAAAGVQAFGQTPTRSAGGAFSLSSVAVTLADRSGGAAPLFLPAAAPAAGTVVVPGFAVTGPVPSVAAAATPAAAGEPAGPAGVSVDAARFLPPAEELRQGAENAALLPAQKAAASDAWFLARALAEESAGEESAGLEASLLDLPSADHAVEAAVAAMLLGFTGWKRRKDEVTGWL